MCPLAGWRERTTFGKDFYRLKALSGGLSLAHFDGGNFEQAETAALLKWAAKFGCTSGKTVSNLILTTLTDTRLPGPQEPAITPPRPTRGR